jgi:hypothetical protein
VREPSSFDYAILRVVPLVERHEFLNAGVVLFCRELGYLGAATRLDESRLRALAPGLDVTRVHRLLELVERIAAGDAGAGPDAALDAPERFHWLVSPSSTVLQASPVHGGLCRDPEAALGRLLDRFVTD